jgi:hypothetical protein
LAHRQGLDQLSGAGDREVEKLRTEQGPLAESITSQIFSVDIGFWPEVLQVNME